MGGQKRKALPRRWRWVTLTRSGIDYVTIWHGESRPAWLSDFQWVPRFGNWGFTIVPQPEFKAMTGLDIKPGSCQKVTLIGKIVSPVVRMTRVRRRESS